MAQSNAEKARLASILARIQTERTVARVKAQRHPAFNAVVRACEIKYERVLDHSRAVATGQWVPL